MRKYNRFSNGRSTFKCVTCDRMTRDTGQGVDHLCMECFEIAGLDNQVNDSGEPCPPETLAFCERYLAKIAKLGGNVDRVRNHNSFIWPCIRMVILTRFPYTERARAEKLLKAIVKSKVYEIAELNDSGLDLVVYTSEDSK